MPSKKIIVKPSCDTEAVESVPPPKKSTRTRKIKNTMIPANVVVDEASSSEDVTPTAKGPTKKKKSAPRPKRVLTEDQINKMKIGRAKFLANKKLSVNLDVA